MESTWKSNWRDEEGMIPFTFLPLDFFRNIYSLSLSLSLFSLSLSLFYLEVEHFGFLLNFIASF
jgi:hypothetical protein